MKRPLVLLLLVLMTATVWAQQISEEQARDRALKFLANNAPAKTRGLDAGKDRKTVTAKTDAKSIYAFNLDGGGFVIASGDSRALPVLGYSDTGTIDWDRMPDNMRAWLKSYDQAMATLGDTKAFADGVSTYGQETRSPREAIAPLIRTQWDQMEPYWNDVPPYDGANPDWKGQPSLTGCVATAMAMVMNYYQWPKDACTEIPAYDITTAHENVEKVWHIDALPPTTFDWVNMLDNYVTPEGIIGTPEQQEAVAADNENGMFATMFIGEIDLRTGVLEYCNCGHNPPVVGGQFLEMPKSNAPIGLWPGLEFIGHTVEGMKGKMLLLYTDGVTEAENMDQKQTGDDWLIDILKEHPMDDSREMVGDILREVATHVGEAEPSDDITLLCLRIT